MKVISVVLRIFPSVTLLLMFFFGSIKSSLLFGLTVYVSYLTYAVIQLDEELNKLKEQNNDKESTEAVLK